MPRPSVTVTIASLLFAAFSLSACKTVYTDMYSPRRNYFKPVKETPKPAEALPTTTTTTTIDAVPQAPATAPGLDALPGAAPAPEAAPAPAPAPAPVPPIPGLQ